MSLGSSIDLTGCSAVRIAASPVHTCLWAALLTLLGVVQCVLLPHLFTHVLGQLFPRVHIEDSLCQLGVAHLQFGEQDGAVVCAPAVHQRELLLFGGGATPGLRQGVGAARLLTLVRRERQLKVHQVEALVQLGRGGGHTSAGHRLTGHGRYSWAEGEGIRQPGTG